MRGRWDSAARFVEYERLEVFELRVDNVFEYGSLHGKSREVMMLRILRRFGDLLTMGWIHNCCCCLLASFPQNSFLSRVSGRGGWGLKQ